MLFYPAVASDTAGWTISAAIVSGLSGDDQNDSEHTADVMPVTLFIWVQGICRCARDRADHTEQHHARPHTPDA